jgi:hypothetical protein
VLNVSLADISQDDPVQSSSVTLAVSEVTPIKKLNRTAVDGSQTSDCIINKSQGTGITKKAGRPTNPRRQ